MIGGIIPLPHRSPAYRCQIESQGPGSVSALLPNGDVLAGDLVIGGISVLGGIARLGHPRKPPFKDDAEAMRQSLTDLLDRGASRFFVGHGGPLTASAVRGYIAAEPRLDVHGAASTNVA